MALQCGNELCKNWRATEFTSIHNCQEWWKLLPHNCGFINLLKTSSVTPSNSSGLLRCPFCGKNDVEVFPDGGVFIAECRHCRAASRRMPTKEMAAKQWNKRVA